MSEAEVATALAASADFASTLPAVTLRVTPFCSPLWWEFGGHTILANGTMDW